MFNIFRFYLRPFKDAAYIVFDIDSLNELKRIYLTSGPYKNIEPLFQGLGTNHHYIRLTSYGYGDCHIFYLPIVNRQYVGMKWAYTLGVINKMAIEAAFNCTVSAGYDPTKQNVMFIELTHRITERIIDQVSTWMGGTLAIASQASRDIDMELRVDGVKYIDMLDPRTLSDLARTQVMAEDNGVVTHNNDTWSATTYFH